MKKKRKEKRKKEKKGKKKKGEKRKKKKIKGGFKLDAKQDRDDKMDKGLWKDVRALEHG